MMKNKALLIGIAVAIIGFICIFTLSKCVKDFTPVDHSACVLLESGIDLVIAVPIPLSDQNGRGSFTQVKDMKFAALTELCKHFAKFHIDIYPYNCNGDHLFGDIELNSANAGVHTDFGYFDGVTSDGKIKLHINNIYKSCVLKITGELREPVYRYYGSSIIYEMFQHPASDYAFFKNDGTQYNVRRWWDLKIASDESHILTEGQTLPYTINLDDPLKSTIWFDYSSSYYWCVNWTYRKAAVE